MARRIKTPELGIIGPLAALLGHALMYYAVAKAVRHLPEAQAAIRPAANGALEAAIGIARQAGWSESDCADTIEQARITVEAAEF